METTFDFAIVNNIYECNVDTNIILRIKQLSNSIAVLYLTDDAGNKINIPNGLAVYKYDYHNTQKKQLKNLLIQDYTLYWTNNYVVEFQGKEILDIASQKIWNIKKIPTSM